MITAAAMWAWWKIVNNSVCFQDWQAATFRLFWLFDKKKGNSLWLWHSILGMHKNWTLSVLYTGETATNCAC